MLTPDDLRFANVNLQIAREALSQAEKRLTDALEAKRAVEQKATVLFGAYVTISLALFGFGGSLLKEAAAAIPAWPFFAAGVFFVFGASAFAYVFRPAEYGNHGSEPSMWLQAGRIDGDEQALARMLAYLAYFHAQRIAVSYDNNTAKSRALKIGMGAGILGAGAFCVAFALTFLASATRL